MVNLNYNVVFDYQTYFVTIEALIHVSKRRKQTQKEGFLNRRLKY